MSVVGATVVYVAGVSKTRVNQCGELVRRYTYERADIDDDSIDEAIGVVEQFRAAHSDPLVRVRIGVESMAKTASCRYTASQRLKRVPRIIRKLQRTVGSRHGRTSLARLEDIGGVRVVVADGVQLDRLRSRVETQWPDAISRRRDYIAVPKEIGYRAVHLVVKRDGRAIEIQLRTRGQQQWADAAEAADARLFGRGVNLKDGDAPAELAAYFSATGEMIYRREYGLPIPWELEERVAEARRRVISQGYYTRGRLGDADGGDAR